MSHGPLRYTKMYSFKLDDKTINNIKYLRSQHIKVAELIRFTINLRAHEHRQETALKQA